MQSPGAVWETLLSSGGRFSPSDALSPDPSPGRLRHQICHGIAWTEFFKFNIWCPLMGWPSRIFPGNEIHFFAVTPSPTFAVPWVSRYPKSTVLMLLESIILSCDTFAFPESVTKFDKWTLLYNVITSRKISSVAFRPSSPRLWLSLALLLGRSGPWSFKDWT